MKISNDFYEREHLSLIPIPFKEKGAVIKWQEYQTRKATPDEIQKWFFNNHQTNLAIVCGAISENLVVLDCDADEKFWELASVICEKTGAEDIFDYTAIVKTGKGWHIYFKTESPVKSLKFPKLDIKGEGGYVIGPPSVHPSGSLYTFANETGVPPIRHIKSLEDVGIDLNQKPNEPEPQFGNRPGWVNQLLMGVGQGGRNDAGAKLAGYFRNVVPIEVMTIILHDWNQKNTPPLPDYELNQIIKSSERYVPRNGNPVNNNNNNNIYNIENHDDSLTIVSKSSVQSSVDSNNTQKSSVGLWDRIKDWIPGTNGAMFYTQDLDSDLGIKTEADKHSRYVCMQSLVKEGFIVQNPKVAKQWRFIQVDLERIDYKSNESPIPLSITMPLGISKLVNLYPGNLVVIAGTTNAGKTALLLDLLKLNNNIPMTANYWFSEGGRDELRSRLDLCDDVSVDDWKFDAFSRSSNFEDVIVPNALNVVDYLELGVTNDFFEVNKLLKQMVAKIGLGLLVVAIQKNSNSDYGRGGMLSAELARLYVSLDEAAGECNARAKIMKGKAWAVKNFNPNKRECIFHIENGWIEGHGEWVFNSQT